MNNRHPLSHPLVCGGLAILVCILWGLDFVLIKLGYQLFRIDSGSTGSILLFAGVRFVLAGLAILVCLSVRRRRVCLLHRGNAQNLCLLALIQTVAQYVFLYLGMARTSAVNTSILDSTLVFFSILCSSLLFHQESLTFKKLLGCILGFCGILVMNLGSGDGAAGSRIGDLLVLLCAFSTGLSHALVKKLSAGEEPAYLSGWQLWLGGLALTGVGLLMGGQFSDPPALAVGVLLSLSAISAVTGVLWSLLLKYNPVSSVNIYFFVNPLFGVLFSALILGETGQAFRAQNLAALLLVCAGVIIISLRGPRAPQ